MCVVSQIGDYWRNDFEKRYPSWIPNTSPSNFPNPIVIQKPSDVTKEDIEQLRSEIRELKELLKAAIKYDEKTSQPHCENEEKIALIKQVAQLIDVDLSDLNLND